MCTIKRVGRWGDFSPSAFYLLNIINDQSLFFTKVFRKHWCLTAVLQYLKMHKCCSYVKNLELDRDQGLLWEGRCIVQESSVRDRVLNPSLGVPFSLAGPFPSVSSVTSLVVISIFPSFISILLVPLVPPQPGARCPSGVLLRRAPAPLPPPPALLLQTPVGRELLLVW